MDQSSIPSSSKASINLLLACNVSREKNPFLVEPGRFPSSFSIVPIIYPIVCTLTVAVCVTIHANSSFNGRDRCGGLGLGVQLPKMGVPLGETGSACLLKARLILKHRGRYCARSEAS